MSGGLFYIGVAPRNLFSVLVLFYKNTMFKISVLTRCGCLVSMDDPGSLGYPPVSVVVTIKPLVASREGRQL